MERTKKNKENTTGIHSFVKVGGDKDVFDLGIHMDTIIIDDLKQEKTMIGVDNGVTGGVTILSESGVVILHIKTPVKNHLSYTKKKAFINRIDFQQLKAELEKAGPDTFCYIERPLVNPTRFMATVSAVRCLEATEIILEELQIPYQFLDSKEWQKELLPSGLKGDELKRAADAVAQRLFPKLKVVNSDCLLIAEYCRRKNTNRLK
ncbi:MAG: hypothetical protein WC827_03790 [Candidatus Paceibacterota bacterium]|jgi:hypothetical protein